MSDTLKNMYTALITPFFKDGSVDYETLINLLIRQQKSEIEGIVLLSTTSESATLTEEESLKILTLAKQIFKKDIIIGISENDPLKVIHKIKLYNNYKPNAYLICSPFYNKGNEEGIYKFYKMILQNSNISLILYNVPSRTGYDIPLSVIKKLVKEDKVIGIKNASYNYRYYEDLARLQTKKFKVLCGNDDLFLMGINLTNSGIISVSTNLLPNYFTYLYKLYFKDYASFLKEYLKLNNLFDILNKDINPIMIKEMMNYFSLCENVTRIPLICKKHKIRLKLKKLLKERMIYNECYSNW